MFMFTWAFLLEIWIIAQHTISFEILYIVICSDNWVHLPPDFCYHNSCFLPNYNGIYSQLFTVSNYLNSLKAKIQANEWVNEWSSITDEQFDSFKTELKWRIIKKKLVKQFEIEVKEDEIFQFFVNAVRNYSPYMDEASLKNTVFSLMQNREQLNSAVENISSGKLFDAIREVIQVEEKSIDKDGFYKIVETLNQKVQ